MTTVRSRGEGLRRVIRSFKQRMLEALESRLLLSGNSYTINAYSFSGGADGASPFAGMVADTQGDLFGVAASGGTGSVGTLYELPASRGSLVTIHAFTGTPDGANPYGALVMDTFGNLFGTTYAGGASGNGTVFEIPAGTSSLTILHSFSGTDGANPYAGLTLDSFGDIFGTTVNGGSLGDGTVFEIPSGGAFTTLYSFSGSPDGAAPYAPLLLDGAGDIFGTTFAGGSGGDGTVFEISGGTFTTLHAFTGEPDGAKPTARLILDGQGDLLGTTFAGGTNGDGTIFTIPAGGGVLTSLYSFTGGMDGAGPYAGLVYDSAGDLFGTTFHGGAHGDGAVFEIPAGGQAPVTLFSFTGGVDGASPYGQIYVNAQGDLYGTSTGGGTGGHGTIFELIPTLTTQISVGQQPSDLMAGASITPPVVVDLELDSGGMDTADNSSVTLAIVSGPSGATLGGTTTVQAQAGVVTFSNLKLTHAGTYTLAAVDGTLAPVTLESFVVNPGPAARLVYGQQPTGLVAGKTMVPAVTVDVEDALGNVVTTDNSTVTLQLSSEPSGATLGGTQSAQAVDGVATFDDLSLTKAGSYTVSASDGTFPSAKSTAFAVTPDSASAQLVITRQPGNSVVGRTIAPAVIADVQDQYGNLIASNTSQVTASLIVLSLGGNATGASLTGTTTVKAVKGVATLGSLAITQPGSYELQIAGGGLAPVLSSPIQSYFVPTHLVFTQQPTQTTAGAMISPAVTVSIEDSSNRIDTTNNSMITISLKGSAILGGNLTVEAVNGVATFQGLSLTKAGSYLLTAASGTLTAARSAGFTVLPDLSTSQLVALHLPAATTIVGKMLAPNLVVDIVDQFGNLITSDHSAVTVSIVDGPTDGTVTGATTISASGGAATLRNLSLSLAGSYSLQIADVSLALSAPVVVAETITQGVTTVGALPATSTHVFGQTIALAATFKSTAPSAIAFTGGATITDSTSDVLGTVALTAGGAAKFSLSGLAPGTYLCTASYPGDANHTAVTSSAFTLVVNMAGTTTTLAASTNSLVFGQPLVLTANVNTSSTPSVARTGNISFFDGSNLLETVTLNGSSAASLTLTPANVGAHAYRAVYSGDGNFKASTSSGIGRPVNKNKTSITLTPSLANPIAVNQTFSLTVHVALISPGASTITGDLVTIKDNGKVLTTLNLDSNGDATLPSLSYSAPATYTLTAIYAGDTDTLAVTSSALKLTII